MCALLLIAAGCGTETQVEAERSPRDVSVDCRDTVISAASERLGYPVDIAVDEAGRLYVVNAPFAQIHQFLPTGQHVRSIGRKGAGPGEFDRPGVIALHTDTLRVVDRGNDRLQVLTTEGIYVRSYQLPPNADGDTVRILGEPVVAPIAGWDFVSMKSRIRDGVIPDEFRNMVRPVRTENGVSWLVLTAEGRVQRYDATAALAWDQEIEAPELETIRDRFFEQNREDPAPFSPCIR